MTYNFENMGTTVPIFYNHADLFYETHDENFLKCKKRMLKQIFQNLCENLRTNNKIRQNFKQVSVYVRKNVQLICISFVWDCSPHIPKAPDPWIGGKMVKLHK